MSIAALIEAVEAGDQLSGNSKFWAAINDAFPRQGRMVSDVAKAYHGSLNDAMALHEALLPGVKWVLFQCDDGSFGCNIGDLDTAFSTDPARAWLLAILRAKEAGQ